MHDQAEHGEEPNDEIADDVGGLVLEGGLGCHFGLACLHGRSAALLILTRDNLVEEWVNKGKYMVVPFSGTSEVP